MPYCIYIDYDSANLSFLNLDDFYISFDIQKQTNLVVHKVTLVQKIILKLGEIIFTRTYYIAMPSECSFLFSATYPTAANAFIDSKILKTAYIMNLT